MITRRRLLFVFALLISGCAGTPPGEKAEPDWLSGDSARYPSDLFLQGRGTALQAGNARDLARSDLAKVLEVAIQEKARDARLYEEQRQGDEQTSQYQQQISRELITQVTRTIQGVEIGDIWFDPANGNHHALAILSRQKAREQLRQRIDSLDQQTRAQIDAANKGKELLLRAAAANNAVKLAQQRAVLQQSLQAVDASGVGAPAHWSLAKLATDRDELLQRISITPEQDPTLTEIVSGAITHAGLKVGSGGYRLATRTVVDEPLHEQGWIWLRGNLEIGLYNSDNKALVSKRWPLKVSSTRLDRAQARLLDEVKAILDRELRETLLQGAAE